MTTTRPPEPDDTWIVTYEDAVACYGPSLVTQIMAVARHHDGDDGPYWTATEIQDIADLIFAQTTGGSPR